MSILVDEKSRVVIQGITGREGMARAQLMKDYGTNVVAGVTPGRGGQDVYGVPVYDSVEEAWEKQGPIDVSVIFIPAALVKNAALEAIAAGVKLLVIVPDRVPIYDVLEIARAAAEAGARFVGPNTLGLLSPGKAVLGMIGGRAQRAREWFKPGAAGRQLPERRDDLGHLLLPDPGRHRPEHDRPRRRRRRSSACRIPRSWSSSSATSRRGPWRCSARSARPRRSGWPTSSRRGKFTKPLIAYIGGKAAKSGTRFSHAGAIVEGGARARTRPRSSACARPASTSSTRSPTSPAKAAEILK